MVEDKLNLIKNFGKEIANLKKLIKKTKNTNDILILRIKEKQLILKKLELTKQ